MGSVQTNIYGNPNGDYNASPYGTNSSDAVTYSIGDVAAGNIIDNAKFVELLNTLNSERSRRGHNAITNLNTSSFNENTVIEATDLNYMIDGLSSIGAINGYGWSVGTLIYSSHINTYIDNLQSAGAACVCNCNYCTCNCNYCTCNCNYCTCNCNYCTCNCNYCTCNCNYACTCNCNYSDERLKNEITYM